ncbi:tyrosine-type recombinase/integrase [Alphaproteobacteria bacterium]|nr:tyrosine-type recombinase/integrase [Alphaproteobacteria bacterium]
MIDALFAKFEGAFAQNTIRGYRHDFDQFAKWCVHEGIHPLPAPSISIAAHIDALTETHKAASIRRRINALSTIYRLGRLKDSTKDPDVTLAMKRMHRKLGRAQKQAKPLTKHYLDRMIAAQDDSPRGLRNSILLLMGYETMRRRAELVGFDFEDVTCLLNGKPALRLKFSKADQYGEGRLIGISEGLDALIATWRDLVGPKGKILRSIDKYGNIGERLEPSAISYILRQVQANITLPENKKPRQWTGHSFRVGAAIDLVESGYTIEQVMRKGDWKSAQASIRYVMVL